MLQIAFREKKILKLKKKHNHASKERLADKDANAYLI